MAPVNPVRRVWAEGRAAVNGWIAVPSVLNVEAMAKARWDALTVDMQHGTADYADLLSILPVIEKSGAAPIVRVPWLDEAAIMRSLDAGALGIIAPMIETREDAERLVSACRYPPDGARSFGPVRARFAWGDDYARIAKEEVLVFAMIETKAAVANLDAILSVPGLSGIYIGPADLSLSHGFSPGFDREEPEMQTLIADIRKRSATAGLRCCLHCGSPAYAARAAADGMDLVTIGSDARFVEAGAAAAVKGFRDGAGNKT
ncbi:HpcH/HpaI aldolase family protein [Oricola indica]|uniref:HpcH/HpaI aldolase family protein n=1 Tax=Oricola indica TaxID=2872591 RepID=UPI003CCBF082